MSNKVYQKYIITKTNGQPVDPEARYFVLRIDRDDLFGYFCRRALNWMVSDMLRQDYKKEFANEIHDYVFNNSPMVKAINDLELQKKGQGDE